MEVLLYKILGCEVCKNHLPFGPRPVVQLSAYSKIIIICQAPGIRVHETRIPWNDASGRKLQEGLHVDESTFYDPFIFSIMPMGFCYPCKGISGYLSPRHECAPFWHSHFLKILQTTLSFLLTGQYAQYNYLKKDGKGSLTETVKCHTEYLPKYFPLPHPSPRNQNWVKINPWFMEETIPECKKE
jgi:uracil-DNA glycosylase